MINEETLERLRSLIVETVLVVRREYLQTSQANMLEHWRIVFDRMQIASRTARNVDQWWTSVLRRLQIQGTSKVSCSTFLALSEFVHEKGAWKPMRDLLDKERGLLEALARRSAEQDKMAREELRAEEATA